MHANRSSSTGRLLITGASGYIGARLVTAARRRDFEVTIAARRPERVAGTDGRNAVAFDLSQPQNAEAIVAQVDAIVHLAAIIAEDSQPYGTDEDLNVSGTRRLLEAARASGVGRFVFVSSQSAVEGAPTKYGRSKWQIEQMLTDPGEIVVLPGMVSGGPPRGLYGLLYRIAKRFPLLPMVRPSAPVYPVHVDDLCSGILDLLVDPNPPRRIRIAPREATRFADYVRSIARLRAGRKIRLIPVPSTLILLLSWITERLPFLPTVGRERVMGLIALQDWPADAESRDASSVVRPLESVLAREGRNRRLLAEGRLLMRYILGGRPSPATVRRYVRAVRAEADSTPCEFGALVRLWPRLLRWSEPLPSSTDRLRRRLTLATRIAEMTPQGAVAFHAYRARPFWLTGLQLALMLSFETLRMPIRVIRNLVRSYLKIPNPPSSASSVRSRR